MPVRQRVQAVGHVRRSGAARLLCHRLLEVSPTELRACDANGQNEHGDSFAILDNLEGLPYNAQDEPGDTDEDCREACLNKCYCIAYSSEYGCKLWYYDLYNLSSPNKPPYSKIYVRAPPRPPACHRRPFSGY
ncbi:Os05g0252400 [Oryza sativa Japonica Group]|uniref:Os05g0252400 protein n=5 Tax=Oryza TaxID=4527 RepID=B9FJP0_ORYSJ|nr:hypothetical protein OsI_19189 [Oryza sativa Indica Group]EEE63010.1 hypothetical protein OsJ_17818 [Oryza sativa Japonica Group]BAS93036.1 Os05g0252400 [Oryza sativa Japonica Group]